MLTDLQAADIARDFFTRYSVRDLNTLVDALRTYTVDDDDPESMESDLDDAFDKFCKKNVQEACYWLFSTLRFVETRAATPDILDSYHTADMDDLFTILETSPRWTARAKARYGKGD